MANNNSGIALGLIMTAGVAVVALMKLTPKENRLVVSFHQNPDGTCTYTYTDGSIETGDCISPPS